MHRGFVVLVLTASLTLAAASARADEERSRERDAPAAPAEPAPPAYVPPAYVPPAQPAPPADVVTQESVWYGGAIIGSDVGALALVFAAGASNDERGTGALLTAASAVYVLGGPIVHVAHGRRDHAALSLAMRLGLPLAGGLGGAAMAADCNGDAECGYAIAAFAMGFSAGLLTAVIVDDVLLARDTRTVHHAVPTWGPTVAPAPGGFSLGMAGSF